MAKSWHYPRWRRILMQVALWCVLGATLGVAALVNYERRQAMQMDLSDPVSLGPLRVRVPKDWKVAFGDGESRVAALQAREPGDGGRVLTIEYQRARELVPPLRHLADNGITLLGPAEPDPSSASAGRPGPDMQRLDVAGWPGVMVADLRMERSALLPMVETPRVIIACAVLPSRDAVILRLIGVGPSLHFDQQLVRQIGQAIETDRPIEPLEPVETVGFPDGMRLVPPDGFRLVPHTDPNRLSRQLILEDLPGQWTGLELIPCFFPLDGTGEDLLSMLWARDNDWWAGSARQLSPHQWRADLPETRFTTRAYVIADEAGHGLIALFRGMEPDAGAYDAAWETIAGSVSFASGDPFPQMLATGDRAGVKMRELDLADLLEGISEDQWWLWLEEAPAAGPDQPAREAYLGWTRLQHFHDPDKWSTRRHSMSRQFDQQVLELEHNAESADGTLAEHDGTLEIYAANFTARPELKQVLHAQPGNMTLHLTVGRRLPLIRMSTPDRYIPGGWFSLLAGHLVKKPMIVQTDALLGYDGLCPPRLLTLIVEPGESGPLDAAGGTNLRWMNVSINGSGQMSRWYFDEARQLVRIESADGMVHRRSDRDEIASGFAGDRILGRVGQDGFR